MGPIVLERMDDRLDAIETAFVTALSTRIIKRELMHFDDHEEAEINAGVLMIASQGEGNYSESLGMVAKEGTQRLLLIGHLKLAEAASSLDVENAEIDFIEELKAALRLGVDGLSFSLKNVEQSAQLDKPYGWFVASVDAGPPLQNSY